MAAMMDVRNAVERSATLVETTELSQPQLARLLGLSVAAYERRRLKGDFSHRQRTKLARVVNVVERAQRVLGGRARAQQWLIHPNRALRFSTPLGLLETTEGTQRVFGILMRIEAGAFA
jgi:putative toxin-antitoxin system antitoxin component (TIGR02293 family)